MVVGAEYVLAGEQFGAGQEATVAADRIVDFESVLLADDEIVLTVAGCRVHRASTGFEGDVIADHHQ